MPVDRGSKGRELDEDVGLVEKVAIEHVLSVFDGGGRISDDPHQTDSVKHQEKLQCRKLSLDILHKAS